MSTITNRLHLLAQHVDYLNFRIENFGDPKSPREFISLDRMKEQRRAFQWALSTLCDINPEQAAHVAAKAKRFADERLARKSQ